MSLFFSFACNLSTIYHEKQALNCKFRNETIDEISTIRDKTHFFTKAKKSPTSQLREFPSYDI